MGERDAMKAITSVIGVFQAFVGQRWIKIEIANR